MSTWYRYVKINRPYFCLQQNPVILAWLLYVKNRSLQLDSLRINRRQAISVVKSFLQHRFNLRDNTALELPVYGDLCLPVHRGYRVFDLRRRIVTRVFAAQVDTAVVAREIERVRKASLLGFAPTVRRWSIEGRWYEEDFVVGRRAHLALKPKPDAVVDVYHRDLAPCIEGMILLQPPGSVNVSTYVAQVMHALEKDGLSCPELDATKVKAIESFTTSTAEWLYGSGDRQVELVFSHGDFSLRNVLRTGDSVVVIDWEGADRRSVLFDLHNYFFAEAYYDRINTSLVPEIREAIASLHSCLTARAPGIARTLPSLVRVYCRLYYLERILMLLEREPTDALLDVILRSIEIFSRYEEAVASGSLRV
jgi:hypothetical protein